MSEPTCDVAARTAQLWRRYRELCAAPGAEDDAESHAELQAIAAEVLDLNRGLAIVCIQGFARVRPDRAADYLQAALLGLWEAFLAWDPDRPGAAAFSGFSRSYIEGRIRREVAAGEYDGMSYATFTLRARARAAAEELAERLGRNPGLDEIAAAVGSTPERIRAAFSEAASLETATGDRPAAEVLADLRDLADVNGDERRWLARFARLTRDLTPPELFVLIRRKAGLDCAAPQSLNEVSAISGLGREVLRRIEKTAQAKLRAAADAP